jgi:hypothetical protein
VSRRAHRPYSLLLIVLLQEELSLDSGHSTPHSRLLHAACFRDTIYALIGPDRSFPASAWQVLVEPLTERQPSRLAHVPCAERGHSHAGLTRYWLIRSTIVLKRRS